MRVNTADGTALGTLWRARSAAFLRMLLDDSAQALVEYCVVMGTLTIVMLIAYRNFGTAANSAVGRNANNLTNSSVVAP